MRSLSSTIARLQAFRPQGISNQAGARISRGRLNDLTAFGTNPGSLRARMYVPAYLPANAPLVVVLHGCTQTADGYDHGTGWSELADREGFALLYPEQHRGNNPNLCFNWFVPGDITRGQGEVQSIAQMIMKMLAEHPLDSTKVFITGLSAGGAMTSAMLATYPELFAGGAIIAGLPYACAANIPDAFERMRGQGGPSDAQLVAAVECAAGRRSSAWPSVSIWHGTADATVSASNMARIGAQWRGVHRVDEDRYGIERGRCFERRSWTGSDGQAVVEEWSITGMGHGVPIEGGGRGLGAAAPYILETGISSTERIASFWGIANEDRSARPETFTAPVSEATKQLKVGDVSPAHPPCPGTAPGVQRVIEDALRAAGLMR